MRGNQQGTQSLPTPRQLRIEIAKSWSGFHYELAAAIRIHPVRLSAMLSGRHPLQPHVVARLREVLAQQSPQDAEVADGR